MGKSCKIFLRLNLWNLFGKGETKNKEIQFVIGVYILRGTNGTNPTQLWKWRQKQKKKYPWVSVTLGPLTQLKSDKLIENLKLLVWTYHEFFLHKFAKASSPSNSIKLVYSDEKKQHKTSKCVTPTQCPPYCTGLYHIHIRVRTVQCTGLDSAVQ